MNFKEAVMKIIIASRNLSNKLMTDMIPIFVDEVDLESHNCGTCSMRIPGKGDVGACTIVDSQISLSKGTCSWWTKGEPKTEKDIHLMRMDYTLSGYVESPSPDFKIHCATCRFIDGEGYCKVWMANVKKNQCCMIYDNPQVKPPKKDNF